MNKKYSIYLIRLIPQQKALKKIREYLFAFFDSYAPGYPQSGLSAFDSLIIFTTT